MNAANSLRSIKLLHTLVWAFLAGSVLAIPITAWRGHLDWALGLTALILLECLVLALNKGRCPLTNLAERYTDERADNFDIYLPMLLARHNKTIFGGLFICGELVVFWYWIAK